MKTMTIRGLGTGCSAIALTAMLAAYPVAVSAQELPLWQPYVDLGGRVSESRDQGSADLYVPIVQDTGTLTMLNLRGVGGNDDYGLGEIGLIHRRIDREAGLVLGANAFASLSHSETGNTFWHASLGAEAMTEELEVRANAYLPISDPRPAPEYGAILLLPDNQLRGRAGEEVPMAGVDAEIGYRLPLLDPETQGELRLFGGAYYFDESGVDDVTGLEGRLEYRAFDLSVLGEGSRLTAYVGVRDDDRGEAEFFGGGQVRIPLDQTLGNGGLTASRARELTALERRMEDPLYRRDNPLVIGAATGPEETLIDPETGVALTQYVQIDGATADLQAMIDAFGPNTLVLASGAAGDLKAGLKMQDSQTWLSGGTAIPLIGAATGQQISFSGPGSAATISGDNALAGIQVEANGHLAGFTIRDNTVGRGVLIAGNASNVTVQLATIENVATEGIGSGADVSDIRIRDNLVSGTGKIGISIFKGASDVLIAGNTVADAGTNGISLGQDAANSQIIGNTVTNAGITGIQLGIDVTGITVSGNTVLDAGANQKNNNGIGVSPGAVGLLIENNFIANAGWQSISIAANATDVTIRGNTIHDAFRNAIWVQGGASDITIADNVIRGVDQLNGIFVDDGYSNLQITGNMIDAAPTDGSAAKDGTNGIVASSSLGNQSSDFVISDNIIVNFNQSGINTGVGATVAALANNMVQNNSIQNVATGIVVGEANDQVIVSDNAVGNTSGNGINVANDGTNIQINTNKLFDIGNTALSFGSDLSNVAANGNHITGTVGGNLVAIFTTVGETNDIGGIAGAANTYDVTALGGSVCVESGAGTLTGPGLVIDDVSAMDGDGAGVVCGTP